MTSTSRDATTSLTRPTATPVHDLRGKTVIVTGGNGGIGLGLAQGVARAGARVAIWGRNAGKNEAALDDLRNTDPEAVAFTVDIADEQAVESAFADSVRELGHVDAFFANAGIPGESTSFVDMTFNQWRDVLSVNLDGTFLCLREAARHMVARGTGSLIPVSSIMNFYGGERKEHYAASKAGIEALSRGLAVELAKHGIRVNSLVPGWTDTELVSPGAGFIDTVNYDKVREYTRRRTPIQRWGTSKDMADIAAFLADPSLVFHTGDTLVVDGAYTRF
ncbi:SDR family NAD(P)-dependent oxidoreductase [Rhodococcus koreensis]|uniref:SDR family NAD(P)-dependent oxidoreductase n=1 Tax=Rhodococcus koreensis TaxID=99653 RepID=UPI00366F6F98